MATITTLLATNDRGDQIFLTQTAEGDPNVFEPGESITFRDKEQRPIDNTHRMQWTLASFGLTAMPRGANIKTLQEYMSLYKASLRSANAGEARQLEMWVPELRRLAKEVAPGFEVSAEQFVSRLLPQGYRQSCDNAISILYYYQWNPTGIPDAVTSAEQICARLPAEEQSKLKGEILTARDSAYAQLSRKTLDQTGQALYDHDFDKFDKIVADAEWYAKQAGKKIEPTKLQQIYQWAAETAYKKLPKAVEFGERIKFERYADAAERYAQKADALHIAPPVKVPLDQVKALRRQGYLNCIEKALWIAEERVKDRTWHSEQRQSELGLESECRGAIETARFCAQRGQLPLDEKHLQELLKSWEK